MRNKYRDNIFNALSGECMLAAGDWNKRNGKFVSTAKLRDAKKKKLSRLSRLYSMANK